MQSENRSNLSQSYCTWGCRQAVSFRYDLILFDKYTPEKLKMFFDAKIRMIPRDVSINMRNESKKD